MNREEILSHVDHTLLKPEATWPQIQTLCDEAIANHTASVCINTCTNCRDIFLRNSSTNNG